MEDTAVQQYYEGEARQYDAEFYGTKKGYPTLQFRHKYMLEMALALNLPPDAKILDVGCGPGEMVLDLCRQNWEVWGIDIADNMIKIAKEKHATSGKPNRVHLSTGDIEALEFPDNQFDLVICSGVVEYLHGDEKWTAEMDRVLKTGGVLIINVTNKMALRKWTAPLLEPLKRSKAMFGLMNFVKEKVLRRGRLHHFPFRPRTTTPWGFDKYLADHGYRKLDFRYFDFSLSVAPFDTLFSFITLPIRRGMERYSHRNWWLSGIGYIVSARLERKSGNKPQ